MDNFGQNMTRVGRGMTAGLTLPLVGLGAGALKLASDFESSFAGVRKTVNATEEEFAALSAGFRAMSKEIPISVDEINRIGEAAGQLGIKTENILGFTRVMADLGVATNLSAEEAATSLARLANITQMPQDQFDRLGSTVVALGNNLATTESEIVEFGLRLAGAGAQLGLSEAQILSIGGALSSVGLNAEAGGTAVSKVMINMASAVSNGGQELEAFAKASGTTAAAFKQQFQTDAAGALVTFVEGLGKAEERGTTTLAALEELGISEIRMRDALLRAAGASDLLARSLDIGTTAWEENTALTREAEQRYATFASQMTIVWNTVKDLGITVGTALMPVMLSALEVFKGWIPVLASAAQWFADLSPGLQKVVLGFAGLLAAIGPLLLVFGVLASSVSAVIAIWPVLVAGFTLITGPIGLAVIAIVALVAAWYKWGDDVKRIVGETVAAVKTWLVDNFGPIIESTKALFHSLGALFEIVGKLIGAVVEKVYGAVKEWILDKLQPVITALAPVLQTISGLWTTAKDVVVSVVRAMYTGIKEWLVDKLAGIIDSVREKVDAVTGFFGDMFDKVVGHSIVPDMVNRIAAEFDRMGVAMIDRTEAATTAVEKTLRDWYDRQLAGVRAINNQLAEAEIVAYGKRLDALQDFEAIRLSAEWDATNKRRVQQETANKAFAETQFTALQEEWLQRLAAEETFHETQYAVLQAQWDAILAGQGAWRDDLKKLGDSFAQLAQIAGDSLSGIVRGIGSAISSISLAGDGISSMKSGFASLTSGKGFSSVMGGLTSITGGIAAIAPLAMMAWQGIKKLFGGASAQELGGREIAREFDKTVNSMFTAIRDRVEPAHEQWQRNNILLREAYVALGHEGPEAIRLTSDMLTRLHQAEQQGAGATREVMATIVDVLERGLTPASQAFGETFLDATQQADAGMRTLGNTVGAVKALMATPVVIPVIFGGDPRGPGRGPELSFQGSGIGNEGESFTAFRNRFLDDNPGDEHRLEDAWRQNQASMPGGGASFFGEAFSQGTQGQFLNFGAGTPVTLHGRERVVTEAEGRAESAGFSALLSEVSGMRMEMARAQRAGPRQTAIALHDALVLAGVVA